MNESGDDELLDRVAETGPTWDEDEWEWQASKPRDRRVGADVDYDRRIADDGVGIWRRQF